MDDKCAPAVLGPDSLQTALSEGGRRDETGVCQVPDSYIFAMDGRGAGAEGMTRGLGFIHGPQLSLAAIKTPNAPCLKGGLVTYRQTL